MTEKIDGRKVTGHKRGKPYLYIKSYKPRARFAKAALTRLQQQWGRDMTDIVIDAILLHEPKLNQAYGDVARAAQKAIGGHITTTKVRQMVRETEIVPTPNENKNNLAE